MTLLDVIRGLDALHDGHTIYATQIDGQWRADSPAVLVKLADDGTPMQRPVGMKSVLPVFLAKEVIEDWQLATRKTHTTPEEKLEVIIHYAEYDAAPPIES